jgi:hypothetical protein
LQLWEKEGRNMTGFVQMLLRGLLATFAMAAIAFGIVWLLFKIFDGGD